MPYKDREKRRQRERERDRERYRNDPEYRDRQRARQRLRYQNDTEFRRRMKDRVKTWQTDNRDLVNRRNVKWQRDTHYYLRRTYKITYEQFQTMLAGQGGRCAACRIDDPGKPGWQVDHDHSTGAIRGILCQRCNLGLGHARDSVEITQAWTLYLQRGGWVPE